MGMNRGEFIASLSMLAASLARAGGDRPANRNIKWALSEALWRYYAEAVPERRSTTGGSFVDAS